MITKFKIYEVKEYKYYDFYDDMFKKKIRDVNHYINIIKNSEYHVSLNQTETLFHWAAIEHFSELAEAILDILPLSSLKKLNRSIAQLPYKYFSKILRYKDLYKTIVSNTNIIEDIIYYGRIDSAKKLFLLKNFGAKYNNEYIRKAAYAENFEAVKYFFEKEKLDPSEKVKTFDISENALDDAAEHNKGSEVINYLVTKAKVPVTYRHIYNVINNNNLNALPALINSKNIIDDYAFSYYSTYRKHPIYLTNLIQLMVGKDLMNEIKILLSDVKMKGYDTIQTLTKHSPDKGDFLDDKTLKIVYWIISNYDGDENSYTTRIITKGHKDFWIQKIKENPKLIYKMINGIDKEILKDYEIQKILLDDNERNIKYIIDKLDPKIEKEYKDIPEIFDITLNKYNI